MTSGTGACTVDYTQAGNASCIQRGAGGDQRYDSRQGVVHDKTVGDGPFTYDGTTHTGGSGTVTGAGGINTSATC